MRLDLTSLLLEAVNFLVLVWILSRLVYRPLSRSIEERRIAQENARREAEEQREQAAREMEDVRRKHAEVAALRERVMREAAEDAATERARLLAEAREDAAAVRAQGQKLLEAERREAKAAIRDLAIEQSTHIAARLLAELSRRALDDDKTRSRPVRISGPARVCPASSP